MTWRVTRYAQSGGLARGRRGDRHTTRHRMFAGTVLAPRRMRLDKVSKHVEFCAHCVFVGSEKKVVVLFYNCNFLNYFFCLIVLRVVLLVRAYQLVFFVFVFAQEKNVGIPKKKLQVSPSKKISLFFH